MRVHGISPGAGGAGLTAAQENILDTLAYDSGNDRLQLAKALDANSLRILNVGTPTTAADALGYQQIEATELPLVDVTTFATWPPLWRKLGPPTASALTAPGGADPAVEVVSTNCRIHTAHADTSSIDDDLRGNGISRPVDLTVAHTCQIKVAGGGNFANITGGTWQMYVGCMTNGGGTNGWYFSSSVWYSDGALGTAGDPFYDIWKEHKLGGATGLTSSNFLLLQQADGDPTAFWIGWDWDPDNGYKTYWSSDGISWTETGSGSAPTGYVAPQGNVVQAVGRNWDSELFIMCGRTTTEGTAGNANYIDIEDIAFGGSFA
jgi:hypothetical protein